MSRLIAWAGACAVAAVLSGCGGGSGGGDAPPPPPSSSQLGQTLGAAAAIPANDTAINSSSAFTVLQSAGVPAVTVRNGITRVNFAVFSDLTVKTGLTNANVRFAIAKLVPGTNGNLDQWQSYVFRIETPSGANNVGSGPGGTPVLASAKQATTDPNTAASLVANADGYYTYTFTTNITDPTKTDGVTFDANATHRIAIQLSYNNRAGQQVLVNPYIDVRFDGNGNSVIVTDPAQTRVMADVSSCNGCHDRLALHGGGRVDVQYCVMCHNPRTVDANSGNVLTMATMTHKIHAGRLLKRELDAGRGGVQYVIWGFGGSKHDYSEVGFPQDLRNCTVCHSGANPKTPQGDLWKQSTAKEACLTCHASGPNSAFKVYHDPIAAVVVGPGADASQIANADCAFCHRPGTAVSPERVHFNQNEEHAAKYKVVIDSATYDATGRKVTVKYSVVDPTNGNARYNLVTSDCTGSGATLTCSNQTRFGNLRFYVAYPNMVGQSPLVTEFSSYNNGGSSANAFMYKGTNDGANSYTVDIPLPADGPNAQAFGTARVVGIGQVKEAKLQVKDEADPRPEVTPRTLINVVVQHANRDVLLSGEPQPRRQVVSNEKCNVCHGALGTTSGSNTLAEAFHSGARNTVESCNLCHDENRFSSTVMTNGMALSENYGFKRMIHGIHGNSKRSFPFTHGNTVIGEFFFNATRVPPRYELKLDGRASGTAAQAPTGTPFLPFALSQVIAAGTPFASGVENYAAEVAYPAVGLNCNGCHVNDSWRNDRGVIGSVVRKPLVAGTSTLVADPNPRNWGVISPQASSCTACHDSPRSIEHVVSAGAASFGTRTQGEQFTALRETCVDCHAPGSRLGVDTVHKQ
ncbi:MAG: OmcA/MtrC family decaheme c-type cytochrome [Burkholderiales bacterium]|nr:OmcA/MtrC family decaheme c-type cytochrome [Burkholderiales bacterium]